MRDNWLFYKGFVDGARTDYHDNRAHGCAEFVILMIPM